MSFNSCVVEESDRLDLTGTQKAYQMFMYWRYGYSNTQMRFANVAFNFNTWLSAPDASRDSVAYAYFRDYVLRDNGNGSWSILHQYREIYTIETQDKLLSEPGATWTVTEKERVSNYMPVASPGYNAYNAMYDFSSSPVKATISVASSGQWTVEINDYDPADTDYLGGPAPHLSVTLSTPDQSVIRDLREGGYYISGHGYFEFAKYSYSVSDDVSNAIAVYFNMEEPLWCDGQDTWSEGNMNMVVYNGETVESKTENVNVKFTVTNGQEISTHYAILQYYAHEAMWSYGDDGGIRVHWGENMGS